MTTTDIAIRATAPLEQKIEYARFLSKSGLLPGPFRNHPENVLYAYEYGEMLGLHPIASITAIDVIEGKPSISAGLMSALVRRAGHTLRVQAQGEGDQAAARCQIIRKDDPKFTYSATWTMQRAKAADLLGKTNWRRYPLAMLKARAISECCRDACQEVLLGIAYTPDELGGEDDGGELVHDGFPTTANGMVDGSQLSEEAKERAGLMNRRQRIEHAELVEMNKVDPADVEIVTEHDENDPWEEPAPVKVPAHIKRITGLLDKLPLGDNDARSDILSWIVGRSIVWAGDLSVGEAKNVGSVLEDHLKTAGGDTEQAASALWEQYHKAQENSNG